MTRSQVLLKVFLCGVFASSLFALDARAGEDEASRLFREGRAAMNAGDYETAADKLFKSHKADPSPGTLLNLAICEEKLGRLLRARKYVRGVLADLPEDDPRRPVAEEQAKAIDAKLPRLTVRLAASAKSDVSVELNGKKLGSGDLGKPIPLDPGAHTVVVSSPEGVETHVVEMGEGERKEFVFQPPGSPGSSKPQEQKPIATTEADTGSGPSGWGYVLLGVGVVGVAAGGYLWYDLDKKQAKVYDNCDGSKQCNDAGLAAAADGRKLVPFHTGAWIAGAAGLVGGTIVLLATGGSSEPATQVGAAPLPGGATVGVSGRF